MLKTSVKTYISWSAICIVVQGLAVPRVLSSAFFLALLNGLLAMSFLGSVQAQEPAYLHYGLEDGLPSSEVYQSIQDDAGFMWFATDRGLLRFDGYDFKVFGREDGLVNEVIFGFYKDYQKRIWMYSFLNSGLNYLKDGKVFSPAINDSLQNQVRGMPIGNMYIGPNDSIWLISLYTKTHHKVAPSGSLVSFHRDQVNSRCFAEEMEDGSFIFGFASGFDEANNEDNLWYKSKKKEALIPFSKGNSSSKRGAHFTSGTAGDFCSQNRSLIRIQSEDSIQSILLPSEATQSLFQDSRGDVWVGMFRQGALRFEDGDLKKPGQPFLEGHSVSSVLEDREGGMWFTTLDNGIFYVPSLNVSSEEYRTKGGSSPINVIHATETSLWIGTKDGELFKRSTAPQANSTSITDGLKEVFSIRGSDHKVFVGSAGHRDLDSKAFSQFELSPAAIGCIQKESGLHWTGPNGMINENDVRTRLLPQDRDRRPEFMAEWNEAFYLATDRGLFVLDMDSNYWHQVEALAEQYWISEIQSSAEHLFLATRQKGLLVFDGAEVWSIGKDQGLDLGPLNCLAVEQDSIVWVGSKKGVKRLVLSHVDQSVGIQSITKSEGLISDEVNDLEIANGRLWVATHSGLTFFPLSHRFIDLLTPKVFLEEVIVNGSAIASLESQEFDPSATVFDFHFTGLHYKSAGKLNYRYRLLGYDREWSETMGRQVRYMLPPGEYSFEVFTQSSSGTWSEAPAVFSFSIRAPFWQQLWFIGLLIIGVSAASVAFFYWRLKVTKARAELELNMVRSQQQALNAQLKPHFIFNALNSVHNYIRKNDKVNSGNYLLLFSSLIRQILDNSNNPMVKMSEELGLVEKYLQLEQLRFKDRMTYSIEVESTLDTEDILIPTQLVQPYVENAIWHGLMHKEDLGHVSIVANLEGDSIVIVVKDDGVGRAASRGFKLREYKHESSGMKMNEQRLKLIQALYNKVVHIEVKDMKDETGAATGTEVVITIPMILK